MPRIIGDKPAPPTEYVKRLTVPLATHLLRREHLRDYIAGRTPERLRELATEYGVKVVERRPSEP